MKTAFSIAEDRIAPLFDVARQIALLTPDENKNWQDCLHDFAGENPLLRLRQLREWEVAQLVCGAISRPLEDLLLQNGIHVLGFRNGAMPEILQAWREGRLESPDYRMPGCGGRRRGQGGRRRGTRQGTAGPRGDCLCPDCGHRQPHQRGIPCQDTCCPRCGTALRRP